jgi:hypothetical protein
MPFADADVASSINAVRHALSRRGIAERDVPFDELAHLVVSHLQRRSPPKAETVLAKGNRLHPRDINRTTLVF